MIEILKIIIYTLAGIVMAYVMIVDIFEKNERKRWKHEKVVFWLCSTAILMIFFLILVGLFETL